MPPKGPKAAPKAGAKKGPPAGMLAKLKMKMEMQAAEEERIRQEEVEEERRLREEERLAEEQRKFEEEERLREKEHQKELERREKKINKGNRQNDALDRMRACGFIVPDVEEIRKKTEEEKERVKLEPPKPKPKPKPKHVEVAAPAPVQEPSSEDDGEVSEPTESEAEVDEDDWEALMERDERREKRHENNLRVRAERAERRAAKIAKKDAAAKKLAEQRAAEAKKIEEKVSNLRSPICCVVGHVDTGKTSLLDRLRRSNVQGGEAGGITQQIGATFYPLETLEATTKELNKRLNYKVNVPGLLFIDTPGHESFTNLRSRGTSLCDIAILIVDIMHGLEQQTVESIALLQKKKCPFIIALNKVDRIYDWVAHDNMDIQSSLALQKPHVRAEYSTRVSEVKRQLLGVDGHIKLANKTAKEEAAERGPRTKVEAKSVYGELYYENTNDRSVFSIVPISAKTGEGIPDLLLLEVKLVQQFMEGKVTFKNDLQCTVLEVKPTQGLGFTVDAILVNGELREGDTVCFCGDADTPIFTQIRSLLTPQPLSELRVKGDYIHHKSVSAAIGIKIAANDLEHVVPGTSLVVVHPGDDREAIGREVMREASNIKDSIDPNGVGVLVQSSTMGALEALISFLGDNKVPVGSIGIGPLHKRHMHQVVLMKQKMPRYATVLAFDVPISDDIREMAAKHDVRIFASDTIYKLFEDFSKYNKEFEENEKTRLRERAVYPVQLKIIDDAIRATDPIILPVRVERGKLLPGTPLCALHGETVVPIGRVMTMEKDGKALTRGRAGEEFAVKINSGEPNVTYGRQFSKNDPIVSMLTRPSVDAIKELKALLSPKDFEAEISLDEINLLATLVKVLKVPK